VAFISGSESTPDLLDHVVDDMTVLALRAEHDDLRIRVNANVVPGGPVVQVTG
jgi:hypothetical protein